ncbi:MAG: GNAT family N-acetyltransferase [Pseudomonadota bacterium]
MQIHYEAGLRDDAWAELSRLYDRAGFVGKTESRLKRVFGHSQYQSYAYDGDTLVAVGRAFSDGGDCAVVCDVAVTPNLQGKGIGKGLVKHLLDQIPPHERIMLFATLGIESLYEQFGFGVMTTGMCRFKDQLQAIRSGLIVSGEGR